MSHPLKQPGTFKRLTGLGLPAESSRQTVESCEERAKGGSGGWRNSVGCGFRVRGREDAPRSLCKEKPVTEAGGALVQRVLLRLLKERSPRRNGRWVMEQSGEALPAGAGGGAPRAWRATRAPKAPLTSRAVSQRPTAAVAAAPVFSPWRGPRPEGLAGYSPWGRRVRRD